MPRLTPTHDVVQYIKSNIDAATRFWLYLVAFLSGAAECGIRGLRES